MASQLKLQIQGLYLTENQFSAVPPGSLEFADNIVIDYPSVAQSRRGFRKSLLSAAAVDKVLTFNSVIHAVSDDLLHRNNAGSLTAYSGSLVPPIGFRNRFSEANEALYFTTSEGIKKIFTVGGSISLAGVQRALDGIATANKDTNFVPGNVNTADDRINFQNGRFLTGLKVRFSSSGTLPGGLVAATDYWIHKVDDNNVDIYNTLANARLGGVTGRINLTTSGTGTHTMLVQDQPFLSSGNQVGYRALFGYRDSNGYLFRGAPSGRTITENPGANTVPCSVSFPIPNGVKAGDFLQIYRTVQSPSFPNDEMFLLVEITLTSADISAKEVYYYDQTQDSSLGEALYTNASQQGILSANDEPPFAVDITNYKGYQVFGNTRRKQTIYAQIVAIQAIETTVAIGAETYTAKASENIASKHFQVFTSGTDEDNIRNTATSLVRVINSGSLDYYAYYLSTGNPEGIILIQGRTLSTASFVFNTSSPESYTPAPPTAGITSDAEDRRNRVYISKPQQPDAVPLGQFFEIGNPDKAILRVIALRDSIFVFKEDGIFRIVGDSFESMRISVFDRTAILLGSETAVVLDNSIYLHTNRGVLVVSDNGLTDIGSSIEIGLQVSSQNANFQPLAFGLSDETNKRYVLYYPVEGGDSQSTQAFVFSVTTSAWTKWTFPANCGFVDKYIILAGEDSFSQNWVYEERLTYTLDDYVDHLFSAQIISLDIENNIIEFRPQDIAQLKPGVQIIQGQSLAKIVAVVDSTTAIVEFTDPRFTINKQFLNSNIDPVLFTINIPNHRYETGDFYKLTTSSSLPTPLLINTDYYVIVIDEDTIQLATNPENAISGTPIPLVDNAIGAQTILSGTVQAAEPINVKLAWNSSDGGDPSMLKHFQQCNFLFGNSSFESLIAFFKTSFSPEPEAVPILNKVGGQPWGLFPWGEVPWGDSLDAARVIQTYIPREKRRGTWIYVGYEIAEAFSDVQARGISIVMQETGEFFR